MILGAASYQDDEKTTDVSEELAVSFTVGRRP
jgi:hypothetical protein